MPSLYVTPNSLKNGGLSQIDDEEAVEAAQEEEPRFGAQLQSQGTSCFEHTAKGSVPSELSAGRLVQSQATSPPRSQDIPVQQLSDLFQKIALRSTDSAASGGAPPDLSRLDQESKDQLKLVIGTLWKQLQE